MRCLLIGGPAAGKFYEYDEYGKSLPYVRIPKYKKLEQLSFMNIDKIESKDLIEEIVTYNAVPFQINDTKIFIFKPDYMSEIDMMQALLNGYRPIEAR